MKKPLHKITAILFLTLLILPYTGCEKKTPYFKNQAFEKVVVVGSHWYGHIPVWVGRERGIFLKHDFDVEWRFIGSSMSRLNAISSGKAQFASLGEIAMLIAMAGGNKGFYWVGNQDNAPGLEGLVAAEGINSYEELCGKTIGFPFKTSVDLTCRMLLEQHNIDPDRDNIKLVNINVDDVPAVFLAGNVDAAVIWEPGLSRLFAVEGATLLGRDTDIKSYYNNFKTMTGPDVLIISRLWVDENPSRAKRFLKAYFESLKWVKEDEDQAIEIVQGKYIKQRLDIIKKNMEKLTWYDLEVQKRIMSEEGIYPQAEFIAAKLKDLEYIQKKPDFRKWVNLDILPFGNIDK